VLPIISPQIIDTHHPFPHLLNKNLNIFLMMEYDGKKIYGTIPIPNSLERVIYPSEDEKRYILLEKILYEYAEEIFSNYDIIFKTVMCVVRNADISLSASKMDEDEDYRGYVKKILKKRRRLAPICLEFYKNYDENLANFLCEKLNIKKYQVQISNSPLEMSYVFDVIKNIEEKNNPLYHELSYIPFESNIEKSLKKGKIIPQLNKKDILLYYPYDSMEPFLKLLKEASNDKKVVSIKITIYRLSSASRIIKYLIDAVENGKDVTVLIELRARFDENNNINYAAQLQEAGCQVIYGFEDYKVHSKICLITRKNSGNVQYITQIGTGNYNEKTSKKYADLSFITMDKEIGKDSMLFFRNMTISNLNGKYKHLLVAPNRFKKHIIEKINTEIKKAKNNESANIIMKMNSLTDREMIDILEKASNAGVKIKLIVRGICCLVPGIKEHTENIEIISIVGRFLEHSRIYCFGSGEDSSIYLSSADLMTRNTEKRVEIAFPIYNPILKEKIQNLIKIMLSDNVKARKIDSEGNYNKIDTDGELIDSQNYFLKKGISPLK
ncbi:MAG: polyphosphate kinase 1, partial [Methanobrevibacter sp.]|nr:polyphosphate kinase 1 [Methanobrevibacter sp.]